MMKNQIYKIFGLAIFLLITVSCTNSESSKAPKNQFTVKGNVTGLDTEFMSITYIDTLGSRIYDSVAVKNNEFSYVGYINTDVDVFIWTNVERTYKRTKLGYNPVKSMRFAMLASPGDNIVFTGEITDFVNAYPSGTDANNDLAIINSSIFPLLNQGANLELVREKLMQDNSENKIKNFGDSLNSLNESIFSINNKVVELKMDFLKNYPSSKAAAWYLSDMMMRSQISDSAAVDVFKNFDRKLEGYLFYEDAKARVKAIESNVIGAEVEDFTSVNVLDGSNFKLSDLRGKYVLVDFWGTWCGPCVSEMPKLKEYQKLYEDRLVIVGINNGDTEKKLMDFVKSKDYNWIQLMSKKGDDDLVMKFNVQGFPTKLIISPEGKLIKKSSGSGEAAFVTIDSLMAK